jgi:hypothetical protein
MISQLGNSSVGSFINEHIVTGDKTGVDRERSKRKVADYFTEAVVALCIDFTDDKVMTRGLPQTGTR